MFLIEILMIMNYVLWFVVAEVCILVMSLLFNFVNEAILGFYDNERKSNLLELTINDFAVINVVLVVIAFLLLIGANLV